MEATKLENKWPKKVRTNLKFIKSEETGAYVSFVSQNSKTGRICGVRKDSEYPKKIVVLDRALKSDVLPNVLYDATLIPMRDKQGYVAIDITPIQFKATIETTYVPKAVYIVEVKFGNKTICFDPLGGQKDTVKTIDGCKGVLEKRVDVQDLAQVVCDFTEAATKILSKMKSDGFICQAHY